MLHHLLALGQVAVENDKPNEIDNKNSESSKEALIRSLSEGIIFSVDNVTSSINTLRSTVVKSIWLLVGVLLVSIIIR